MTIHENAHVLTECEICYEFYEEWELIDHTPNCKKI